MCKKAYSIIPILMLFSSISFGQMALPDSNEDATSEDVFSLNSKMSTVNEKESVPHNFVKLNLGGLILNNYQLQYERVISKHISVALAYRIMPSSAIPFKNKILSLLDDEDTETKDAIEQLRISNYAITPEVRFYLSKKGYGQGFYLAPFFRNASFTVDNIKVTYEGDDDVENEIKLNGKLTSNTVGLLMGVQKTIGKFICLDFWILGPHYGSAKGEFNGITSKPLSETEQDDLRQQLADLEIPFSTSKVNVTANKASLIIDGPWAGFRTGLTVGIRF